MKRYLKLIGITFMMISLVACGSSRKVSSSNNSNKSKSKKKTVEVKKENPLHVESDRYFKKFENQHPGLNDYTIAYIGKYKNIAIDKMVKYKIPASITLAQGILESGNGRSTLALKSNNHFGIKCHKGWNGKKVYHDDDRRHECFRKYDSPEGSFDDHSKFLTTRGRYSFLFDLREDNYKGWAKGLKKAGYATDRKYPSKLIDLVETYNLHHYDKLVLKGHKRSYERELEIETPYIIVSKGDTLYSIARNNNMSVDDLKKFNDLRSNQISIGQKLYLEK